MEWEDYWLKAKENLEVTELAYPEEEIQCLRQEASRLPRRPANGARDPVAEYLAVLGEIYPVAKRAARVLPREDNRVIVSIPLPTRVSERMRLFDRMAEVGTKLLLETDQHIVLSGR